MCTTIGQVSTLDVELMGVLAFSLLYSFLRVSIDGLVLNFYRRKQKP